MRKAGGGRGRGRGRGQHPMRTGGVQWRMCSRPLLGHSHRGSVPCPAWPPCPNTYQYLPPPPPFPLPTSAATPACASKRPPSVPSSPASLPPPFCLLCPRRPLDLLSGPAASSHPPSALLARPRASLIDPASGTDAVLAALARRPRPRPWPHGSPALLRPQEEGNIPLWFLPSHATSAVIHLAAGRLPRFQKPLGPCTPLPGPNDRSGSSDLSRRPSSRSTPIKSRYAALNTKSKEGLSNEIFRELKVIQLDEDVGEFSVAAQFDHPYPATKVMWIPDSVRTSPAPHSSLAHAPCPVTRRRARTRICWRRVGTTCGSGRWTRAGPTWSASSTT